MGSHKILIVEDEPVIALDIEQRLNSLGYKVAAIADSAETALQAASQTDPDLVLMDIHLSGDINGIATCAQLQKRHNLPVVFLTAHTDSATLKKAKAARAFGYITKPFRTTDLSIAIEMALSRYEAESSVQKALAQQEELNRLKSEFVSIVSHEFRNPLGVISITLGILRRLSYQAAAEKRETYFEQATAAVLQMESLLEEFLVLGEAENGRLCCHPVPIDIHDFCMALIDELQLIHGTDHAILLTLDNRQPLSHPTCMLDPKLLRHILINLLGNAIKYSPQGGNIYVDLCCTAKTVTFRIKDEGIGIPLTDQMELFTPFHRATNVGKIHGTGLGLAIVKQCVAAHSGHVTVHSEAGAGATFTVMLPSVVPCALSC